MPAFSWVEAVGYLGSGLVLVSMLMSSVVRLRIINLTGSVIFAVYALLIRSYPTALMNICLVGINIYHLLQLRKPVRHFDVCEDRPDSTWITCLLKRCGEDIAQHFPEFRPDTAPSENTRAFVVLHGTEAVGLLIGEMEGDCLAVRLDYATPTYRDCSVGRSLYAFLPDCGVRALSVRNVPETHFHYLRRMGFEVRPDGSALKTL